MKQENLFSELVCDPKVIFKEFEKTPEVKIRFDFKAQIFDDELPCVDCVEYEHFLYMSLLMFLTHLPFNFLGLKKGFKGGKDKIMFFLPKEAFKEYLDKNLDQFHSLDISQELIRLGEKKVVTQRGIVVELFNLFNFEGIEDYWCLLIHNTVVPYVCDLPVTLVLATNKLIPYITLPQSPKVIVEERGKAGLHISPLLKHFVEQDDSDDLLKNEMEHWNGNVMGNMNIHEYEQVVDIVLKGMDSNISKSAMKGVKYVCEYLVMDMMKWDEDTKLSFIDKSISYDKCKSLMRYIIPSNLLNSEIGKYIKQAVKHGLMKGISFEDENEWSYSSLVQSLTAPESFRSKDVEVRIVFNELFAIKLLKEALKLKKKDSENE